MAAVLIWAATSCAAAAAHPEIAPVAPGSIDGEPGFTAQQSLMAPFTTGSAFREPPVVRSSNGRLN